MEFHTPGSISIVSKVQMPVAPIDCNSYKTPMGLGYEYLDS